MGKINTTQWKEYSISDLFITEQVCNKLQVPTGSYIEKKKLKEGKIPRITVTGINNGIYGYFEEITGDSNYRVFENFISVSFLGTVFYHPYKASLDMKVHSLKLKNEVLNEYVGAYLVSVIKKSIQNNDYADQISSTTLPQLKIKLPVDINGNPNFEYMEHYMKNLESDVNSSLTSLRSVKSLKTCEPINLGTWKCFTIENILPKIVKPKVYHTRQLVQDDNGIPYVVRSKFDNGIKYRVKKPFGKTNPPNVISFGAENASFFYQQEEWVSGRDMYYIDVSQYSFHVSCFLITALQTLVTKYSYNNGLFPEKLKKEKIMLPINEYGEIDYEYMETYMKNKFCTCKSCLNSIRTL